MTEKEMQELFREMREEPVPAESLVRIRAAVSQGIDRRIQKRPWIPAWKIAAALAMAAGIVAGFFFLQPARTIPPPGKTEIAQVQLPAPEPVVDTPPPVPAAARPRRVRPRPVATVPVSIRIETPDPDVVILLVN